MAGRGAAATVAIFEVPALRSEHKNLLVREPPQPLGPYNNHL